MTMKRRQFLQFSAAAAAGLATPQAAWGQAYPTRPVRIIVPFGPGGPTDVPARFIAQRLTENLGRNFLVENVAGASSNIGTAQAAKGGAGRLHDPDHGQQPRHQPVAVREGRVRSLQGFRPDRPGGHLRVCLCGASIGAGEDRQGVDRGHPRQSRQIQLRLGRARHAVASSRRAIPCDTQPRHRARALWRQRTGDHGDGFGSHANLLRLDHNSSAAGKRWQASRAGGHEQEAVVIDAGGTDHRCGRLPGYGGRGLGRRAGAGWNPERHCPRCSTSRSTKR